MKKKFLGDEYKMYYKCIHKSYFIQNKIIDTKLDNYGKYQNSNLVRIADSANFIFEEAKKNRIPVNLPYLMLSILKGRTYNEGGLETVVNDLFNGGGKTFYKLNDLVICQSCSSISGNKIKKLYETAKNVKNVDTSILNSGSFLWEWFGEKIRKDRFPLLPSRLDSYFLFKDKNSAEYYINKHRANEDMKIVMAEPLETICEKIFDMSIWDEDNTMSFYSNCEKQMIRYWSSERNQRVPEVLFQGKLRLFE